MPLIVPSTSEPSEFPGYPAGQLLGGDLQVTLGAVTFGAVDAHGVRIHLSGLKGWWDPPPSTGAVEQRASDDGGWITPAYLTPRVVEISARLKGSSWAHLNDTIDEIVAAVPLRTLEPLYVSDHGTVQQAMVRQEGAPLIARKGWNAEVSLSLLAPDPRKYAVDVTTAETGLPQTTGGLSLPLVLPLSIGATVSAGRLAVTNEGTMATRPVFTVYGPVATFTITHVATGRTLRFHETVPAGRRLVIDTDKRIALLDGTAPRRITGTWFDYDPGVNEVAFSSPTYEPDARLVSEHRSAWR